jgi:HSP20 family protein
MNSLTRRNQNYQVSPLATLLNFGRDFDRLFESPIAAINREGLPTPFVPAVELREDADNVNVSVELPGVDKKDVNVTIHEGVLTISGERKQEREVKEGEFVRTERSYGRFERQIGLSQPVLAEKVKAAYKDGVLTVTLPKTPEAKPKSIDIATN